MIDDKVVQYIANLARIDIKEEELSFFGGQLSKIISYIDKLKEVNVEGIDILAEISESTNVFREDNPSVFKEKEIIIANFPAEENNCIRVPKVIK